MPLEQRMVTQPAFTYHRAQGTLAASSGAILTVDNDQTWIVDKIVLCEYSGNARTFDLRINTAGASDADTQYIFQDGALTSKETLIIEGPLYLSDGDVLKGLASAATSVNYNIHYRKVA
jgi:hypothetical protein